MNTIDNAYHNFNQTQDTHFITKAPKWVFILLSCISILALIIAILLFQVYIRFGEKEIKVSSVTTNSSKSNVMPLENNDKLYSRKLMELSMEIVKDRSLMIKPTESARLYAYTAKAYDSCILENIDVNFCSEYTLDIITYLYPTKSEFIETYAKNMIKIDTDIRNRKYKYISAKFFLEDSLAKRIVNDGYNLVWDGVIPTGPDKWAKSASPSFAGADPFTPRAGEWLRWNFPNDTKFDVPAPIDINSEDFKRQKAENIIAQNNYNVLYTNAINRWGGTPGTEAPAGIWQNNLWDVIKTKSYTDKEYSKIQTILSTSIADSFIECWKVKYTYWFARPSQIISELKLLPFMDNPNFPGYVSGHSTISATAATILSKYVPEYKDRWISDAIEAKNSRLWARIHFPMDNEEGYKLGVKIGDKILSTNK